jgi:uncharacterized damage-inducible protein DinB
MTLDEVRRLLAYDAWATGLLFDRLAALSPEQLAEPGPGSSQTILRIAVHMARAMVAWTAGLRAGARQQMEWQPIESYHELRGFEAEARREFDAYVAGLTDHDLDRELASGFPYGEALRHLLNHGTYHRGQVALLLASHDVECPDTDYMIWVMQTPA